MKKREEDTPDPYLATLIWCRWERNTTGRRAQTPEKRACNEQEAGVAVIWGEAGRTTVRDDRAVYRGWFLRAIREVCTVTLQTGGLHFCRIFTLRIFSLSLSLSLLILAAHGFDAPDEGVLASVLMLVFILARCPCWAVFFLLFWRIFLVQSDSDPRTTGNMSKRALWLFKNRHENHQL
jgi:hypothetical protein